MNEWMNEWMNELKDHDVRSQCTQRRLVMIVLIKICRADFEKNFLFFYSENKNQSIIAEKGFVDHILPYSVVRVPVDL